LDIATFASNTNTPVYYTSTSLNDWNLGGILFSGTPGPITIQSGTTGTGTRRIYFTAGGSGILMDTTVTSSMTFARTGISSGASGDVLFTNNATDSTAILSMATSFLSLAPAASTLVLGGTNTGLNVMGNTISKSGAGSLSITKNDSGTWILNSGSTPNNYDGATTVNAGLLGLGSSTALNGSSSLIFNGGGIASSGASPRTFSTTLNGTLDLTGGTRTITLNNSATLGGVISNGGLTLASSSASRSLTLGTANTYSGPTAINSGTLTVTGSAPNTSSVSVAGGAFLGGNGSLGGPTTLSSGAGLRAKISDRSRRNRLRRPELGQPERRFRPHESGPRHHRPRQLHRGR
jgi:fibronectin-binding autotransporter adhesin